MGWVRLTDVEKFGELCCSGASDGLWWRILSSRIEQKLTFKLLHIHIRSRSQTIICNLQSMYDRCYDRQKQQTSVVWRKRHESYESYKIKGRCSVRPLWPSTRWCNSENWQQCFTTKINTKQGLLHGQNYGMIGSFYERTNYIGGNFLIGDFLSAHPQTPTAPPELRNSGQSPPYPLLPVHDLWPNWLYLLILGKRPQIPVVGNTSAKTGKGRHTSGNLLD